MALGDDDGPEAYGHARHLNEGFPRWRSAPMLHRCSALSRRFVVLGAAVARIKEQTAHPAIATRVVAP
jgi:hypothetical protein